jgi:two-component sensor histidine kinase
MAPDAFPDEADMSGAGKGAALRSASLRRLAAAALAVPLLLFLANAWWTWVGVRSEAQDRVERLTFSLEEQARRLLAVQETLLAGALARIDGMDWEEVGSSPAVNAFLATQNSLANSSAAVSVVRLDTGRFVAWSHPSPVQDIDVSFRDYVKAHRAGGPQTFIGEVVSTNPYGFLGFTISRRDAVANGMAVSLIEVKLLEDYFAAISPSRGDEMALVREDGMVLARSPALRDPIGARMTGPSMAAQIAGALQAPARGTSQIDGVERLYRARQVGSYPVYVVYGREAAAIAAGWRRAMLPFAALTLLASLALFWLARFAERLAEAQRKAEVESEAARMRAEASQQTAELNESLRLALDGAKVAPYERDLKTGNGHWRERIRDLFGVGPELERNTVADWLNIVHPDDRARLSAAFTAATRGDSQNIDYRVVLAGGAVRWIASRGEVQRDAEGRPVRAVGVCYDITQAKRVEEDLAREREQLQLGANLAGLGLGQVDYVAGRMTLDDAAAAIYALPARVPVASADVHARFHADDAAMVHAVRRKALSPEGKGSMALEHRIVLPDGSIRWVAVRKTITFEGEGEERRPVAALVAVRDISERREREERIRFLMREVSHRSKNMLALVQAVARQTVASSGDRFFERFSERIHSMASSQDLLVRNDWRGVGMEELARSQLAHFADAIGLRIHMGGPEVMLSAAAAQAIGMALHELATNAAKHGSLSSATGEVAIEWRLGWNAAGQPDFTLSWAESGGPPAASPERKGFGTVVMTRLVRSNLNADVELRYEPKGVTWRLTCLKRDVIDPDAQTAEFDFQQDKAS